MLFSSPWTNFDCSSLPFHCSVLSSVFLFFCLHTVFWDFSVTLCVSLTNSAVSSVCFSSVTHSCSVFLREGCMGRGRPLCPSWSHTMVRPHILSHCMSEHGVFVPTAWPHVALNVTSVSSNDPWTAHVLYFCDLCWWEKTFSLSLDVNLLFSSCINVLCFLVPPGVYWPCVIVIVASIPASSVFIFKKIFVEAKLTVREQKQNHLYQFQWVFAGFDHSDCCDRLYNFLEGRGFAEVGWCI